MLELANLGFITATDLADYLVKTHSMSFRNAYQKTAAIVNMAEKKKKRLEDLKIEDLNKIEPRLTKEALKVFNLSLTETPNFCSSSIINKPKFLKEMSLLTIL